MCLPSVKQASGSIDSSISMSRDSPPSLGMSTVLPSEELCWSSSSVTCYIRLPIIYGYLLHTVTYYIWLPVT